MSIHAEQLVAVNHDPRSSQGVVHRIGWTDKIPGFGPRDDYTNIAVKVGDKYLLADNVPLNRLAWTNTEVEVGGTPGDGKMVKLGEAMPSEVLRQYPGGTSQERAERGDFFRQAAAAASRRRGGE